MRHKRSLPIPFLILILAGVVSLYSILASRSSGAAMVQDNSLQMQTVEQERMAAIYFRVLSWLSDVTPRTAEPVHANPHPASVPQGAKKKVVTRATSGSNSARFILHRILPPASRVRTT